MALALVTCGWKWLEDTLNNIIEEVNANETIPSGTIAKQKTNRGTLLTATKPPKTDNPANISGGTGIQQPGTLIQYNMGFTVLTVVDPNTCKQTNISVMVKAPLNVPYGTYYILSNVKSGTATKNQGQYIWNPQSFIPFSALVNDTGIPDPSYPSDFPLPH